MRRMWKRLSLIGVLACATVFTSACQPPTINATVTPEKDFAITATFNADDIYNKYSGNPQDIPHVTELMESTAGKALCDKALPDVAQYARTTPDNVTSRFISASPSSQCIYTIIIPTGSVKFSEITSPIDGVKVKLSSNSSLINGEPTLSAVLNKGESFPAFTVTDLPPTKEKTVKTPGKVDEDKVKELKEEKHGLSTLVLSIIVLITTIASLVGSVAIYFFIKRTIEKNRLMEEEEKQADIHQWQGSERVMLRNQKRGK